MNFCNSRVRIIQKVVALRVACGVAFRAFCKTYTNVKSFNLTPGDKISVEYTLEIN